MIPLRTKLAWVVLLVITVGGGVWLMMDLHYRGFLYNEDAEKAQTMQHPTDMDEQGTDEGIGTPTNSAQPIFNDSFSVILVPDTQQYAEVEAELFFAQMRWIVGERAAMNTKFVIHLGDIVQTDAFEEWEVADQAYQILDAAKIPYSVTVGNHDLGLMRGTDDNRDASRFNSYFGPQRFSDSAWYGGHYPGSGNENNYTFFEAAGMQFLVLSLELGPRDEVLEWANTIVRAYPNHRVIVATHSYLCDDSNRVGSPERAAKFKKGYDHDCWGPQRYTGGSDGEMMWEKFVKHHPNIFLVVSGHALRDGAGYRKDVGVHGNVVHQILTNYQIIGYAWLRVLKFFPSENKIEVIPDTPLRLGEYTDAYDHLTKIGYFDPPEDYDQDRTQLPGFFYRQNDPEHMFVLEYEMESIQLP